MVFLNNSFLCSSFCRSVIQLVTLGAFSMKLVSKDASKSSHQCVCFIFIVQCICLGCFSSINSYSYECCNKIHCPHLKIHVFVLLEIHEGGQLLTGESIGRLRDSLYFSGKKTCPKKSFPDKLQTLLEICLHCLVQLYLFFAAAVTQEGFSYTKYAPSIFI